MFSHSKGASPVRSSKKAEGVDGAVTILTAGCHFSGKLYCRGSTRVGGTIEGEIVSEGVLIVEENAHLSANIQAEEIIIQGRVEGKLEAGVRVELAASAMFLGDIVSPVIVMKEGAQFSGRSTMNVMTNEVGHAGLKDGYEPPEVKASPSIESVSESSSPEVSII